MANISHVNHWDNNGVGLTTLSISPTTIGNLIVVGVAESGGAGFEVIGVSCTLTSGWQQIGFLAAETGTGRNHLWMATVTSVGTANVVITYVSTPNITCDICCDEFAPGASGGTWIPYLYTGAYTSNASTNTYYPALVSPASNASLYYGHGYTAANGTGGPGTGAAGDTFTYGHTAWPTNYCYAVNLTPSTSQSPVGTQSGAAKANMAGAIITYQFATMVGNTSQAASTGFVGNWQNYHIATQFTVSGTGTINALSFWIEKTPGQGTVTLNTAAWSNANNLPVSRLGTGQTVLTWSGTSTYLNSSQNLVTIPVSCTYSGTGKVWFGMGFVPSASETIAQYMQRNNTDYYINTGTTPDPFGASPTLYLFGVSIFATTVPYVNDKIRNNERAAITRASNW